MAEEAAKAEDEARKASEKAVIEDEAVAAKESEKRILFFISSQKLQEVKDLLKKNYEEDENLLLSQFAYECVAWSDITTKKGIPVASFEDIDQNIRFKKKQLDMVSIIRKKMEISAEESMIII